MSLFAFLVGLLLLAMMGRPIFVRDVAHLLDTGLSPAARKELGLAHGTRVTERMVSRLFNHVSALIDRSPNSDANAGLFDLDHVRHLLGLIDESEIDDWDIALFADDRLSAAAVLQDLVIRRGCLGTQPSEYTHSGDVMIDGTPIQSFENPKASRRRTRYVTADGTVEKLPKMRHLYADPDANWYSKKHDGPIARKGSLAGTSDSGIGYTVTSVNWTEPVLRVNERPDPVPQLIDHFVIDGARPGWRPGATVVDRLVTHYEAEDAAAERPHRTRGDILADREFTRVRQWQELMHDLGFQPHFKLAKEQHTTSVLPNGIVVKDGLLYSPGLPEHRRKSSPPPPLATREYRREQALIAEQCKPYLLHVDGGQRQDDGSLIVYCGASSLAHHQLACENKADSLNTGRLDRIEIGTALPVITSPNKPTICRQTQLKVPFEDAPFWQPYIPGSKEHQWSINRRSMVEGGYSRIKDVAAQCLQRGWFRVMGLAKVSLVVLVNVMAANMREVDRWRARMQAGSTETAPRKRRKPRRRTSTRRRAEAQLRQHLELTRSLREYRDSKPRQDAGTGDSLSGSSPPRP